jgi:cysteine desulfurase
MATRNTIDRPGFPRLAGQPSGHRAGDGVSLPIYMDNHATTAVDARVLDEMLPYFREQFGNASSRSHAFGWTAEKAVETAREGIARLIGAKSGEIIFTSGATESDNLAIKGIAQAKREKGDHMVTVVTEHKAVLDSCKRMESGGFRVSYLPVQKDGLIDLDRLRRTISASTILVTIMAANNETGVLQPIAEIGKLCRERGIVFHSDAAQAAGKIPINVAAEDIDLLSISAHKLYGPKGVGILYVRNGLNLSAMIDGGGHEHGMRSGTLNVPGIVGLGKACEICTHELAQESHRVRDLRNRLLNEIMSGLDGVTINGSMEHRLAGNLNLSFADVDGEELLTGLDDIALSSGAACTSAHIEPSYVLKALGLADQIAQASLRFGIGRFNTEAEVDYVAGRVVETVRQLRELR